MASVRSDMGSVHVSQAEGRGESCISYGTLVHVQNIVVKHRTGCVLVFVFALACAPGLVASHP